MTRWKLTIEYDGTNFSGWQKQAQAISVQQVLAEAIHKFSGELPPLYVAGRTDAGVHALAQVAHFDLEKEVPADKVRDAINFYVKPHKVCILKAEAVTEDFHARFSAILRSYRYHVVNRRAPLTFLSDYAWHVPKPLDTAPMQAAANLLLGQHDFSTFRAHNCQAKSPIKTMDVLKISQDGEDIFFTTQARSFLYHQVRNIVGTLVLVGSRQWTVDDFAEAFTACDRCKGGPTAPPNGLFLTSVGYP